MLAPQPSQWIGTLFAHSDIAGTPDAITAGLSGAPHRITGTDNLDYMAAATQYPSLTSVPRQPVGVTPTGTTPASGPVDWATGAMSRLIFDDDKVSSVIQTTLYNTAFLALAIVLVAIGAFLLVRD